MSADKAIKISNLADDELDRAIAFNQTKMDRLNVELSQRDYGYPMEWTETAIKLGALTLEKANRKRNDG